MNLLEKFISFTHAETSQPSIFGWAHLFWIGLSVLGVIIICFTCKKLSDKKWRTILFVFGIVLIVLEVLKQLNFAYNSETNTWDYAWKQFPFQFCSVPMYVMILVACLKECKFRDFLSSFLATYGLFAGLVVLIYPSTLLSEMIFRFSQSMLHHAVIFVVGVFMFVSGKVKLKHKTILKALPVFVTCVVIAFVMNIIYKQIGNADSFNMFYIGPYQTCDIPVLNIIGNFLDIANQNLHFGNFVFIAIYIAGFSIAAYIILLFAMLISKLNSKIHNKQ